MEQHAGRYGTDPRKLGEDAHAMTITLLTDSQGNKMGKTAGNAVWLDPNKTSPLISISIGGMWMTLMCSSVCGCSLSCLWNRLVKWRIGRAAS